MRSILALVLGLLSLMNSTSHAQENNVKVIDPVELGSPSIYAHGMLVPPGASFLVTAGQVGADKDYNYKETIEEQALLAFQNLNAIIRDAGMGPENVIKITMYYLDIEHFDIIIDARDKVFGEGFRPPLTAIVVKSLANEKIMVEVEAIAAKVMD